MNLTEDEKRALNTTYLLNNGKFSYDIGKEVFMSLLTQMKENYNSKTESTKIVIPYIGVLNISYDKDEKVYDEDTNKMKLLAVVNTEFEPHIELKRCIGALVDGDMTSVEKKIYKSIENNLKKAVTEGK